MDNFVTILCIVNDGFSTEVMDAAKKCGARGGTVLHGRGTAAKEAEKIFNISIQPEKEVVIILANEKIFGVNLHEVGLADLVCRYFEELVAGVGAVRNTLVKYVGE